MAVRGATWIGAALSVWLTSDGLWARLFGTYLFPPAWHSLWKSLPLAQSISAYDLGWPLVVLGAGWSGALVGLGLGRRWAHRAALILSVAALPWLGASTILGVGSLACLLAPSVRRWVEGRQAG